MKTSADPVRDYLSAVGREASALPADRRRELLADLAEHIEVTRAERPHVTIGEVLAELGDPRTIAATALAEAGGGVGGGADGRADGRADGTPAGSGADAPARRGKVHPLVPLLMLTLPFLFATALPDVPAAGFFSTLFRVIGAVLLCTSVHWSTGRKTVGVLLTAVLPTVAISIWTWSGAAPAGDTAATLANLATLALLAATTAWLWRVRRA
ncbi:HAAS signaling domain-containing protein [Streptomyces sp. NPDC058401]|uniref:HAAS signaling domain-containing protein n=1 Tax=Streptomyces sp. NPDC058401 TaxID=3346480 RepID=UPI003650E93A